MTTRRRVTRNLAWPLILVLGCAHYDVQSSGGDAPGIRLSAETSIFVAMPRDGRYGDESVAGSGAMMGQALVSAISVYAQNVSSAGAPASLEENLEDARSQSMKFLIVPTILRWDERVTKYSGKSDRIAVKLELIEVASEEKMDTSILTGESERIPRVSYWQLLVEDEHVEKLLAEPLSRYVDAIFAP